MDAERELKLKKVIFWELLAVAALALVVVVVLLVTGSKRKVPDTDHSQQTGTSGSLSGSELDTTTDTTDATETTGESTQTTDETTEMTETTEETTEQTTEETIEQTEQESAGEEAEETTEETIEETTEESIEEPSKPSTDPTLPPPAANPIRPEDIVKDGAYLTCKTAPTVVGIDVSEWQGSTIAWDQVKAAGIEFVMIRVGWRGNESGKLNVDEHAQRNYQGASRAGLKIGAYIFSQAVNVREAEEEAAFLLDQIKDWKLDMPVVFDWEYAGPGTRTQATTARTLTDCAKAFCNKITAANLKPMIYFGANHARDRLFLSELTDYDFWFAQYSDTLEYPYKVDMWQYTNKGSVPGINGNVDINLYFPWEE